MASTEEACEPEQEDPQRISCAQQQSPPPISGKKRQRSPSSPPETESKRPALSADRSPIPKSPNTLESPTNKSPNLEPCKPVRAEDNRYCPNCGSRCWLCKLSSATPPDRLELRDEEELERFRMPADDASSTTDSPSTATSSKKRKNDHYASLGIKFLGPRDQGFKDHILDPLGVIWANRPQRNSEPPPFFKSQPPLESRVMIRSDDKDLERITTDFKEYKARPYDEHSLSTLCWDSLILRDTWVENALANRQAFDNEEKLVVKGQEPIRTSVRRDKWKPHKQGPSMPEGRFVYDWELEPDTSYAVSIRMFNLEYRKKLHLEAFQLWVAEKDVAVCPYLTVEYKCSGKGGKQAQATNQGIAAAVLWLYQRKNLRSTIGKAFDGLSHFLITIVDSIYVISEARLEDNEYIMCEQVTGDLTRIDDLKLYIEWSNAIHAWGLGSNASTFKEDIETLVKLRHAQTPRNLPSPAGTVSPMDPPSQRPGQSQESTLHEKEKENPEATKGTT
ncbi:hypothetical protein MMC11_008785 [Xylographa trunciseda]|nr:hypothetical protein [Xylographa trunciseda]